jgi:uncharacterized protein YjbJ (UPF0337 family)
VIEYGHGFSCPEDAQSGQNKPISDGLLQKSLSAEDLGAGLLSKEERRKQMKTSTTDQVKGKLHEVKGTVKETAGQVANNPNLAAEGQNERVAGKIQKKVGQIEKVFEK